MSKEYKKISKFSGEIKQMKAILDLREAKEVKAANKTLKDGKLYTQFFKRTNTDIIGVQLYYLYGL